jgi:hypothetical protein
MRNPDNPWTRSWAAAASLLALVGVALAAVLIHAAVSSPTTPTVAPTPGAGAAASAGNGGPSTGTGPSTVPGTEVDRPAGCTTTGTDQTVPTATPAGVRWTLVAGFAVPSTPADGPTLTGPAGVAYCYSHTPTGALLAASNLGHVTGSPTDAIADLKAHALVANSYTDQLVSTPTTTGPNTGASVQWAGFRIVSYSPAQATVTLAGAAPATTPSYGQLTVALAWSQGDWRVVPQAGPALFVNVGPVPSLASFVPWSGVR